MNRIASVDVVRVIAICFVIAIHTTPFEGQKLIGSDFDAALVVNQLARFAVPFFFVISGYFWAAKSNDTVAQGAATKTSIRRLLYLFLIWSAIYLLPFNIVDAFAYGALGPMKAMYWHFQQLASHPIATFFEGSKPHLWFLTGLAFSLWLSAFFLKHNAMKLLLFVSVGLYFIGLLGKAYVGSPVGFSVPFNFRDGPFFSTIFFVTGYFLYRCKPTVRWFYGGSALALFGAMLHLLEVAFIHKSWGTSMAQDYVFGTYFMGVGVAMVALSNSAWLSVKTLSSIGPLVLGIYASHYAFVDFLAPLEARFKGHFSWEVGYVFIVFIFSYLLSVLLSKYRLTAKLIS
jgi:surface polysaccharide O-acyltransferase-like enzyme